MISIMWQGRMSVDERISMLKAALNNGCNVWNGSEHYGTSEFNTLHLLNAYFTKYPEDTDKVIITMKSCLDTTTMQPLVDKENVKVCIDRALRILDGKCRIDVLTPGRLSREVPIEETVSAINEYVKAGHIGGIGLSECSGESLRRAFAVAPIASVEVELSLFEDGIFNNGVAKACEDLGVPIIAYSPISRGFLTGNLRKYEDMADNDYRKFFPRFAKENFDNNVKIVDIAEKVAKQKGCSIVQVALAWVCQQGDKLGVPVIPIPGSGSLQRLKENSTEVILSPEELKEIDVALEGVTVAGARYPGHHAELLSI